MIGDKQSDMLASKNTRDKKFFWIKPKISSSPVCFSDSQNCIVRHQSSDFKFIFITQE